MIPILRTGDKKTSYARQHVHHAADGYTVRAEYIENTLASAGIVWTLRSDHGDLIGTDELLGNLLARHGYTELLELPDYLNAVLEITE